MLGGEEPDSHGGEKGLFIPLKLPCPRMHWGLITVMRCNPTPKSQEGIPCNTCQGLRSGPGSGLAGWGARCQRHSGRRPLLAEEGEERSIS